MNFPTASSSFALGRPVGLDGAWPADLPSSQEMAHDVTLRGEVEPEARGLDVPGHVARIVAHLLAPAQGG